MVWADGPNATVLLERQSGLKLLERLQVFDKE